MEFEYNDGGRKEAGFKGKTGDCVVRAISIVTKKPYLEIYNLVNEYGQKEYTTKTRKNKSSGRTGVHKATTKKILFDLGFDWTACMGIGTGCKFHLKKEELPMGDIIVKLSKHISVVRDGIINDTYDCSRNETRCVYGYWKLK